MWLFHYLPYRYSCSQERGAATEPHTCRYIGVKPQTSNMGSEGRECGEGGALLVGPAVVDLEHLAHCRGQTGHVWE